MLTRYILHIGTTDHTLSDADLRNWGDLLCSYKREDYGGVVRSFTSKFEFTNQARSLLLSLYMTDGFNASASVSVQTMDNYGIYSTRFTCPLDFSTIEWDAWTLSINAVDNSLAALIKANKSTKYELTVGTDITPDATLSFDRIPMKESVTYGFTQGTTYDDSPDILVTFEREKLPFVGHVSDEVCINKAIYWNDDQEDGVTPFLLRAEKDVTVTLGYSVSWRKDKTVSTMQGTDIGVRIKRNGSYLEYTDSAYNGAPLWPMTLGVKTWHKVDTFVSPDTIDPPEDRETTYTVASGTVWYLKYNGRGYAWENSGKTEAEFFTDSKSGNMTLSLKNGDQVVIVHSDHPTNDGQVRIVSSSFVFSWRGIGDKENISLISPENAITAILSRFTTDPVGVSISTHDTRIASTWLMAAESIRGISGAKFYSSFNEFCDWMSAVFGYVYRIGDTEPSDDEDAPAQTLYFLHRSELLDADADVRVIENCNSVKYTVDSSSIYSSVEAGYDHKDYDSINGRDEFNFSNTYSTGCNVSDKKLSLMSKYRADCYGVEFAVQKRGKDTTDTTSDKDVFFILAQKSGTIYIPDRTAEIEGTLTDRVFNGAFSPMACIRANAGLIGLQSDEMTLAFASSTGNSDVEIDGEKMTDDIEIDTPLATCGVVEFTTDDVSDIADAGELIEIDDNGTTYCGFLKECDIKYAREGAVNYKLIVKEVQS